MVRRRATPVERYSGAAIWSRRLALFSLPLVLLAVLLSRTGLVETLASLGVFAAGMFVAVLAVLAAIGAFLGIWHEGYRGLANALAGLGIAVLVLAGPVVLAVIGWRLPMINDITTDPNDPPRIVAGAAARPIGANPVGYGGQAVAAQQRTAYPDLRPLEKDWAPDQAYQAALDVVNRRRWRILDQVTPRGTREGRIEAVARSLVFGFRDDVVIRIRATPNGSRIDVRSQSRIGRHDFGANARRVRALLGDIDDWQPRARR